MSKVKELNKEMEDIDKKISELFEKRMDLAADVKKNIEKGKMVPADMPSHRSIVSTITAHQNEDMASYTKVLYNTIFDLENSYKNREAHIHSKGAEAIRKGIRETPEAFPKRATVACQGIEGSNSQMACEKMFFNPNIVFVNSFDAVFTAVEKGLCQYGMLPIENSLNGSVAEVYELMKKNKFYIAKSVKMQINHTLLALSGTETSDIKDIYSHGQALGQCSEFLKKHPKIKAHSVENTAMAAKLVSEMKDKHAAAISTKSCAELYGLNNLSETIQNNDNNYTRFICISKEMEIYPGANKTSLMFTTPNQPGALYGILSKFAALGVNLTKLESRPIPGKDFEFMFHVDLDSSVFSEDVLNLICELENGPESFVFLGSYMEI